MKQWGGMRRYGEQRTCRPRILIGMLALCAALICVLGCVDYLCPDTISVYGVGIAAEDGFPGDDVWEGSEDAARPPFVFCRTEQTTLTLGGVIPLKTVTVHAFEDRALIPGGMLFGVRCGLEGVLVVGLEDVADGCCPAKDAGLRIGDVIVAVDGEDVTSAADLSAAVSQDGTDGRDAVLSVRRGEDAVREIVLAPCRASDGIYRAGIWSRDQTAGIGTVTFIDPATGMFGGLGHGICDTATGALLPLTRGTTLGVTVGQIVPGTAGNPGELRGSFTGIRTGTLLDNTACGVIGVFTALPDVKPMPIGRPEELHTGDAVILCTLDDGAPREYAIRIVSIGDTGDLSNKNFVIEITDGELLAKTGGIIQGMSGSPILQDGKLVGAVTHVMVNQPQRGYGIFIRNMLGMAG
ncbi:MAG: PDZ domain-containing protein [Clostridia bacterium]|nr:PDZ domain-containing protein [Clostridia bacterium]